MVERVIKTGMTAFVFAVAMPLIESRGSDTIPGLRAISLDIVDTANQDIGVGEAFNFLMDVQFAWENAPENTDVDAVNIQREHQIGRSGCALLSKRVTVDGKEYRRSLPSHNQAASFEYAGASLQKENDVYSVRCKVMMFINSKERSLVFREPGNYTVGLHAGDDVEASFVVHVRDASPEELRLVADLDDLGLLLFLLGSKNELSECNERLVSLVDTLWASYSDVRTPRYFPALVGAVKRCAIQHEGLLAVDRQIAGGPAREPDEYWDSRYRALRPFFEKVDLAPVDSEMIASLMWIYAELVFLDAKYAKTQEERQVHLKEFERLTRQIADSPYAGTVRRTVTAGSKEKIRSLNDIPIK